MNKLYKKDSKGKIREWAVSTGNDQRGHYYETTHGEQNGAMQAHRTYIESGKNIGRSNETTPEEQCAAEAASLWARQKDRKGYTETIPDEVPMKPMLAKKFEEASHKIEYPCFVQPKLDGGRALAFITKDGAKLISRDMNEYSGLSHITDELASLYKTHGEIILDGELFSKDISFQEIMSLIRKSKNLSTKSIDVQFWVYDMVDLTSTFHSRYLKWSYITLNLTYVRQVPSFILKSEEEVFARHKKFVADKWEGTMIRNTNSLYKLNSRSSDLIKLKDFDDDEFEIVGFKAGVGKFEKVPTFGMLTAIGNYFEGVPKGTEEERAEYLKNAKSYIGKKATVRYFGYTTTDTPVPRFPIITLLDRDAIDPI